MNQKISIKEFEEKIKRYDCVVEYNQSIECSMPKLSLVANKIIAKPNDIKEIHQLLLLLDNVNYILEITD